MNSRQQVAKSLPELCVVAGKAIRQAQDIDASDVPFPRFPGNSVKEAEAIAELSTWTIGVRLLADKAKKLTAILDHLAEIASSIDKEVDRMELFAEARELLEKPDYPIASKSYDASRIALAVKEGFKK